METKEVGHEQFGQFMFSTSHREDVLKQSQSLAVFKWCVFTIGLILFLIIFAFGRPSEMPIHFWILVVFILAYPLIFNAPNWRRYAYYDVTIFEQGFVLRHRKSKSDYSYHISFSDIKSIELNGVGRLVTLQMTFYDKYKQPIKKKRMINIPVQEIEEIKVVSQHLTKAHQRYLAVMKKSIKYKDSFQFQTKSDTPVENEELN